MANSNINPDYLVRIVTTQTDNPIVVTAPMPESFMFDSQSNYEAPFSQGLFGGQGALSNIAKLGGLKLTSQALTAQIWQGSNETQLGLDLEFVAETDPISEVRDPIISLMKLTTPSYDPASGMLRSPGPQIDTTLAAQIWQDSTNQVKDVASSVYNTFTGTAKTSSMRDSNTTSTDGSSNSNNDPTKPNLGTGEGWQNKIKNVITIQIGSYAYFPSVVITNVQKTYQSQIDAVTGLPMHAKVSIQFKPLFLLLDSDIDKIFKTPSAANRSRG